MRSWCSSLTKMGNIFWWSFFWRAETRDTITSCAESSPVLHTLYTFTLHLHTLHILPFCFLNLWFSSWSVFIPKKGKSDPLFLTGSPVIFTSMSVQVGFIYRTWSYFSLLLLITEPSSFFYTKNLTDVMDSDQNPRNIPRINTSHLSIENESRLNRSLFSLMSEQRFLHQHQHVGKSSGMFCSDKIRVINHQLDFFPRF